MLSWTKITNVVGLMRDARLVTTTIARWTNGGADLRRFDCGGAASTRPKTARNTPIQARRSRQQMVTRSFSFKCDCSRPSRRRAVLWNHCQIFFSVYYLLLPGSSSAPRGGVESGNLPSTPTSTSDLTLNSYLNLGWPPATSPSTSILKGSLPAACP